MALIFSSQVIASTLFNYCNLCKKPHINQYSFLLGEKIMERKINITQHSGTGMLWFGGWLFTIGYLQLNFIQGLLGLLVWPYYLGSHFAPVIGG